MEYVILFLKGAVVSLPSIIAAIGIIANNSGASSRLKRERKANFKLSLVEQLYEKYNEIANDYIYLLASIEKRLFEIQEEIIFCGSDKKGSELLLELDEVTKRAIFMATYKSKIIESNKIKIDVDKLVKEISESTKTIGIYTRIIVSITKKYIMRYYEQGDEKMAIDSVKEELEHELEIEKMLEKDARIADIVLDYIGEQRDDYVKGYDSVVFSLNDFEKRRISAAIKFLILTYSKEISKIDVKPLDEFEEQIAKVIKSI